MTWRMRSAAAVAATALLFPRRAVATFPAVGSEIVQKYRDDGYAIVRNVVGGQLLEEMKLHVDWIMAKYPQFPPEHLHHPILRGGELSPRGNDGNLRFHVWKFQIRFGCVCAATSASSTSLRRSSGLTWLSLPLTTSVKCRALERESFGIRFACAQL